MQIIIAVILFLGVSLIGVNTLLFYRHLQRENEHQNGMFMLLLEISDKIILDKSSRDSEHKAGNAALPVKVENVEIAPTHDELLATLTKPQRDYYKKDAEAYFLATGQKRKLTPYIADEIRKAVS